MRIGINLLHAHHNIGGTWNYIKYVVEALGDYDAANKYVAYCTDASLDIVPDKPNFTRRLVRIQGTNRVVRIFYEQTALQLRARWDRLDCMHWFANTVGLVNLVPGLATFHDLHVYEYPSRYSLLYRIYLRTMIPYGIRHASVALPVSLKTASDLGSRFRVDTQRMVVIPAPAGLEFAPCDRERVEDFRQAYSLPDKFWLYVAHCYEHKNHEKLLQAYARLKLKEPDTWPLVLRGESLGRGELLSRLIDSAGIRRHVIWLPRVKSAEMPLLYCAATSLIFPSLYEGLGIPVIEAMACGLPIAASEIPTNREFADGAAVFFDATNADSIADAMGKVMSDTALREHCRRQGLTKTADMRPDKIVARLIRAYELAAGLGVTAHK
jgi:glycosyltransferase involved in cell wall biosynthesis